MREGLRYRAAILMERIEGVRSLADRALVAGRGAPWEAVSYTHLTLPTILRV